MIIVNNSTDKGVVPLTSLNDINGRRIDAWYNGSRLNGQQSCSLIQNSGTDNEFVYVNRASECSSYENASFYRDIDAYIPFFPYAAIPGDITGERLAGRMPNATGRTNHAAPTTGDPKFSGEYYVESYRPSMSNGQAIAFVATLKPATGTAPVWDVVA